MAADTTGPMYGNNKCALERESAFPRLSTAMVGHAHKLEAADQVNSGSRKTALEEGDQDKVLKTTEVPARDDPTVPLDRRPKCQVMLWEWKSLKELNKLDCDRLRQLCADLALLIKQISLELAPLLEEHHNLQEEVDARNVVIHQLLKLTCKQAEFPQRAIQMSVIFPDSKAEDLDSDAASDN
ncbi:unnamed protein product [Ixodes hexagonus]